MPNLFDILKNIEIIKNQMVISNRRIAYMNYMTLFSSNGATF